MATLQVGDETVGYAVEGPANGDGVPLLLFHGTTMSRTAWDMVRAALPGNTYQFVLIEFPGSGESSMPGAPLTVRGLVEQALALMDHLGHRQFHVCGYSIGAVVALSTAAAAPDRVISATSLCGWAVTDPRMRLTFDLWKRLIAVDNELFLRYTLVDGFTVGALTIAEPLIDEILPISAALIAPGSAAHLDLDKTIDIAAELEKITAKTLIIGAIDDRFVDISHSRALSAAIVGSTLVELPAGHMVIQELAVDVANLIREHLSGT